MLSWDNQWFITRISCWLTYVMSETTQEPRSPSVTVVRPGLGLTS